jgi:hypothetical protein
MQGQQETMKNLHLDRKSLGHGQNWNLPNIKQGSWPPNYDTKILGNW